MKPLSLCFLLVILSFKPLWPQSYHPFPDSNATWCDERIDNGLPQNHYYFFYKTNGKTIINDTIYTIISDNYGSISCYLREENKKVFCRLNPNQPEFILYDFDINPGDTILLYGMYSGYVVSCDSLLIGPDYHKRCYIQCFELHIGQFIEGVGSDQGLMYFNIPLFDIWGNLYCFSVNDTIYKTDGTGDTYLGDCWQYIGIPENTIENMKVYPNPTSEHISVNYDHDCKLELYDLSGRLCLQSQSKFMLVKDLEEGIYILRVNSLKGISLNEFKIVKLNAR